jgi:pyruvate/2-oxoglutarate dehydrogenase complex dihydrolipoamide dehydrogenase (E3) component
MADADVIVVGLGPGGEDVAARLARAGLSVLGIDGGLVGGECPYWGCVPSKMMIRAANLLAEARRLDGMAGHAEVRPDWAPVAARIREATDGWDDTVAVERLESAGARFLRGWATVSGPRTVRVDDRTLSADRGLLLDTGAAPWVPPVPGLADVAYWTNRQAVEATAVPASLLVLGGGAIGVELAQVFARFGARVTVVEVAERLLPPEEPEAGELLAGVFAEEGIAVHTGARIANVEGGGAGVTMRLEDGTVLAAERLLAATGRRPDLAALGLGAVGIDESGRSIPVDAHMRAGEGLWAIGDATAGGAFTHMSMYEAAIAADDILGRPNPGARYDAVPRVTFTDPEIGSVGLSEAAARDKGIDVRVAVGSVPESARGWIHKAGNAGLVKLVADAGRGVLVGATSAGPVGGEVLAMLTLAVHAAVPVTELGRMIYAYPTFHRAVEPVVHQLLDALGGAGQQ